MTRGEPRANPLEGLVRKRHTTPRRKAAGLVVFALLALLAWWVAPRPDVRVVNASREDLRELRVCLNGTCETRGVLGRTASWNVPLEVEEAGMVALTFEGGRELSTEVRPDRPLQLRVLGPDLLDVRER